MLPKYKVFGCIMHWCVYMSVGPCRTSDGAYLGNFKQCLYSGSLLIMCLYLVGCMLFMLVLLTTGNSSVTVSGRLVKRPEGLVTVLTFLYNALDLD